MKSKTLIYDLSFNYIRDTLEIKKQLWSHELKEARVGVKNADNQQEVVQKLWRMALIIIVKNGSDNNGGEQAVVFQGCESWRRKFPQCAIRGWGIARVHSNDRNVLSLKYKSSHIGTKGHIAIIVNGYIASYIRLYSQIFMVTIKSLNYDYLARHI